MTPVANGATVDNAHTNLHSGDHLVEPSEDVQLSDTFLSDARFLSFFLTLWPERLRSLELQKLAVIFFTISSCASMNMLNLCHKAAGSRQKLIDWLYMLQIENHDDEGDKLDWGFRPSEWLMIPNEKSKSSEGSKTFLPCISRCYDGSHLTMTHAALLSLICLEDDLERVKREEILKSVAQMQQKSGCFSCTMHEGEEDVRFVYAAVAICFILNDFSRIDTDRVVHFILSCLNPAGGAFGQRPAGEAHAGCTYLALASLKLMGRLDVLSEEQKSQMVTWLVSRQLRGFNGRPSKDEDTCYFFWTGASLSILGFYYLVDHKAARMFASTCKGGSGGFKKTADAGEADPLHTHCVISALALDPEANAISPELLLPLHDALDIPQKYYLHLKQLHASWCTNQ